MKGVAASQEKLAFEPVSAYRATFALSDSVALHDGVPAARRTARANHEHRRGRALAHEPPAFSAVKEWIQKMVEKNQLPGFGGG